MAGSGVNTVHPSEAPRTPLEWAVAGGHTAAAERLLGAGASPHLPRFGSPTFDMPLALAIASRHDDLAATLLALEPPGPPPEYRQLCTALCSGSTTMRTRVVEHFQWNPEQRAMLGYCALFAADLAWFDELVVRGLDPADPASSDLLGWAVRHDALAIEHQPALGSQYTERLIDLGFDRAPGAVEGAVRMTVRYGCTPALDLLVSRYPSATVELSQADWYLIDRAAAIGGPAIVERLVEAGADFDAARPQGGTALWHAAVDLDAAAVELLLAADADPTLSHTGETARQAVESRRTFALAQRHQYPDAPYLRQTEDVQRILALLEAAEAEWHAREQESAEPGDRSPEPGDL